MEYPVYIVEIKKLANNNIEIVGKKHLGEGDYLDNGMIISVKTIPQFIEILFNKENITGGKLNEIKIINESDEIRFRYKGSEMEPVLYINNDNNEKENNNKSLLVVPLEPLWHEDVMKYINILVDELKKYI